MTDDHPPVPALRLLVEKEGSTHHRLHAQRREEVCRDEEALHVLGFVLSDQVRIPPVEGGEPLEGIRLLPLHVEVVGRREGFAPIDVVRFGEGEERDAIDVRHRERPEHQRIDHREHRRVGAEPQSQGDDDDGAHRRALQDAAAGMTHFEAERSHEGISGVWRCHGWCEQRGRRQRRPRARRHPAGGQAHRVGPVPGRRSRPRAGRAHGMFLVQVTEDRFAPLVAAEYRGEKALGEPRRPNGGVRHDSSLPSRPCQRRRRLRLELRIAASPVAVTVK